MKNIKKWVEWRTGSDYLYRTSKGVLLDLIEEVEKPLQEKIHTTNVYYLREIQQLADQLKLADKNYLELKNAFDERVEEAKRERERIISRFENEYEVIQTFGKPSPYITFKVRREDWQALKGE